MPDDTTSATIAHDPTPGKKYFNINEANQALPYVSRVIDDITGCYRRAVEIRRRIEQPGIDDDIEPLKDEYEATMDRLNDLVDELQQTNVELKDFERGLVDFPAIYEGREICLCWHRGEKTVHAWHEMDAGYAGRQDVTLLNEN